MIKWWKRYKTKLWHRSMYDSGRRVVTLWWWQRKLAKRHGDRLMAGFCKDMTDIRGGVR